MKTLFKGLILSLFLIRGICSYSQPVPIELMAGNKFLSIDLNLSKKFSETSKLGFFHMNTLQVDYNDKLKNSFIIQDLLFYEAIRNFRIVGGAFYGKPGFNPTVGFQFNYNSKNTFFLFAPRINITDEPSYDFMTIIQYKAQLTDKFKLFTRLKLLNLFDANEHIKSYQWLRLGLDIKGNQFGLAVDFDEYGPHPKVEYNFGLFIRKEIF